ncbi:MAG: hypothetical protein PVH62_07920 [Anaerolineae bacterium]|jgi:hypothetical protein
MKLNVRVAFALLLIAVGVLFLLESLEVLAVGAVLWPILFGGGAIAFLYLFLRNPANWWAVIPGSVFLGLTGVIVLDRIVPEIGEAWGGALFLGGIGLSFWVIYFVNREHWWAFIPGGVLLTLSLIIGLSSVLEGIETGGILLLGLGVTFGLLSFLPTPQAQMKWALIPAGVLLAAGVLMIGISASALGYLFPAALILAGLYLIVLIFVSRRAE